VLLLPLTDAQFESALEGRQLEVPGFFVPEEPVPAFLGVLRARHAGMLTHWAEIRAVERSTGEDRTVRLKIGKLKRFPRPIEWKQQHEVYRPIAVQAQRLREAQALDDLMDTGKEAAQRAIINAAGFIELETPALDLAQVDRKHLLDRAAGFAARDPARALKQIDEAVTEALRDVVATLYGEPQEEDEERAGWFGAANQVPSVDAYFQLLKEAEDPHLAELLATTEKYITRRTRAGSLGGKMQEGQIIDLIAWAQAVLDAAAGG
jgi:hypothetical protein